MGDVKKVKNEFNVEFKYKTTIMAVMDIKVQVLDESDEVIV